MLRAFIKEAAHPENTAGHGGPETGKKQRERDRREFVRARLTDGSDGVACAEKHGGSGAGVLSSLVGADGLVELPEDVTRLEKGAMVDFLPFNEVSR